MYTNVRRQSLPVRGAWVEIVAIWTIEPQDERSLPVRGAWVEITINASCAPSPVTSLPVRGAWVEIVPFGARI